jgi:hypothetical protein
MRPTIAPGVANRLEKLRLRDVDTYQSKVGEVGNASLHATLEEPNRCGFISTLEGFKSVRNRCEVLQFSSDQYTVLRGVNASPEPITGSTSHCDGDQRNENVPS